MIEAGATVATEIRDVERDDRVGLGCTKGDVTVNLVNRRAECLVDEVFAEHASERLLFAEHGFRSRAHGTFPFVYSNFAVRWHLFLLAPCFAAACGGDTRHVVDERVPSPTSIYTVEEHASQLAMDDEYLYLTFPSGGKIVKVDREDGAAVTLASSLPSPSGLTVDDASVYWMDRIAGTITKMPKRGGALMVLAEGQSARGKIAVTSTTVYWTQYESGTVMSVPLEGGTPTTVFGGAGGPVAIAVDAVNLYWANLDTGTVMKMLLQGGTAITLATDQPGPNSIALGGAFVYWTSLPGGTLARVGIDGGSPVTLASGQAQPADLAVDATSLYWVNHGTVDEQTNAWNRDGSVNKLVLGDTSPSTLVAEPDVPSAIELDSESVYWLTFYAGKSGIKRLRIK